MLNIYMTRISSTHHILEYKRGDGTGEQAEFETRSLLLHDFTHYILETEAKLKDGFFGLLNQGYTFADLSKIDNGDYISKESLNIERVVGPLSSFVESENNVSGFMEILNNMFSSYGEDIPQWANPEVFDIVREGYRRLKGKWNSLKFGETLELSFD